MRDKASRRFHHARSAYSNENGASLQRVVDRVEAVGDFAEPADVRANPSAAWALRDLRRRFVGARVVKRSSVATVTAAFEKLAMHVPYRIRPGLLVKGVHVLCAEKEAVLHGVLQLCNRKSAPGWVWPPRQHAGAWNRTPRPEQDRGARHGARPDPRRDIAATSRPRREMSGCRSPALIPAPVSRNIVSVGEIASMKGKCTPNTQLRLERSF